jgi:hypothetical protein
MKKRFFKSFLYFFFILLITGCRSHLNNAEHQGYFLNGLTGSDLNPGTTDKPLKTIAELNKRLRSKPSDVWLAGDQVFPGTLEMVGVSSPEGHPLTIGTWGSGTATINGSDSEAIRIKECTNLVLNGINVIGSGRKDGNKTNGISLKLSSGCTIENIISSGFQKSGIDLYDCTRMVVKKVSATDNGFCGINIMGSSRSSSGKIMVTGCTAENNAGDPTILNNHSGNGILVGVSDSVTIDHCSATNNGWDMPWHGNGPVGIWAWESSRVTIQYCISYRNKTSKNAKDGGGFDLDGGVTNSVIQYCLSYENEGAGYGLFQYSGASPWSENTVRYCVSINDGQVTAGSGSFFIWNGSFDVEQLKDCMIYNNVAFNTNAPLISFENASLHRNFVFCNNIFLGSIPMSGTNTGTRFIGNDWWNENGRKNFMNSGSLEQWARASGQECIDSLFVGMQADPGLKGPLLTGITDPYQLDKLSGYILKSGSSLRNRGINLEKVLNVRIPLKDFYGNPVPAGNGYEPGICELN